MYWDPLVSALPGDGAGASISSDDSDGINWLIVGVAAVVGMLVLVLSVWGCCACRRACSKSSESNAEAYQVAPCTREVGVEMNSDPKP